MKKYFKFFSVAAIVAAGLVGCSSEAPVDPQDPDKVPAEKTYATFEFAGEGGTTKADLLSDQNESAPISSIRILVYSHNATNTGVCEADTVIGTTGNKSATVLVTNGPKRVLVIANTHSTGAVARIGDFPKQTGSTLNQLIDTKAANKLYLNEVDFGLPALSGTPVDLTSLDFVAIAGPSNFLLSNTLADTSSVKTLESNVSFTDSQNGTKNSFVIYVKRSVAKLTLYYKDNSTTPAVTDGMGTLSDITWGVRNQNRATALFQKPTTADKPQAPFYDELTSWTASQKADTNSYKPYWWRGPESEIKIPLSMGSIVATGGHYYIPENANATSVYGNATYAAFKAKFSPANGKAVTAFTWDDGLNGVTTVARNTAWTSGTTFWRVSGIESTSGSSDLMMVGRSLIGDKELYSSLDLAHRMAWLAEHSGKMAGYVAAWVPTKVKIQQYTNGNCYYRLNISEGTNQYIVRNYQYQGRIDGFNTLGEPNLGDLDKNPEKPINEPTYVTAVIQIIPWKIASFNGYPEP